ncbi:MAG: hypothetical protein ACYS8W_07760 [Planctomycetota bacterium]
MPSRVLRFSLVLGLLMILFIGSGGWSCHAKSDDPIYIPPRVGTVDYVDEFGYYPDPPYYDLYVQNNDSYGADIYVDDILQGLTDPYEDLTVLDCPEYVNTTLEAESWDPNTVTGWGPDIVDTTGLPDYTWVLDPSETFDISVENLDPYENAEVWIDDIYQDFVDANGGILLLYGIPVNHATDIYIEAFDGSWYYWETPDTRPHAGSIIYVTVP